MLIPERARAAPVRDELFRSEEPIRDWLRVEAHFGARDRVDEWEERFEEEVRDPGDIGVDEAAEALGVCVVVARGQI